MIRPSLIYAAVTILLAFVDSVRIKRAKGIVENINHFKSTLYAIFGITFVAALSIGKYSIMDYFVYNVFIWPACLFVRLAVYDPALSIMRRMKIDYESPTTSSYVDNHTTKLTFWDKRILAVAGWGACVLAHYLIFKK